MVALMETTSQGHPTTSKQQPLNNQQPVHLAIGGHDITGKERYGETNQLFRKLGHTMHALIFNPLAKGRMKASRVEKVRVETVN